MEVRSNPFRDDRQNDWEGRQIPARSGRSSSTEAQRRRLLGAALKCFSHAGYLGTTVSAIAADAGVSHGLVHHYFGSKERLFAEIVRAGLAFLQEARELALAGSFSAEDQLRRWVYVLTHSLGSMDESLLFRRLVLQILGAPGMHPDACIQLLQQYTQAEVGALTALLQTLGRSSDEASQLGCLAFNTLVGSQMMGTWRPDHLKRLYETGCHLLGIAPAPVPEHVSLPEFPWTADGDATLPCFPPGSRPSPTKGEDA